MAETENSAAPRTSRTVLLALIAVVLATGVAGLSWLDARHRIDATQEELARRLREIESDAREARLVSRQAQEALRDSQGRIAALESRLAESQSQQLALEALYQDLSRNRDEWQLAEIEQVLAIASQQLQLARNATEVWNELSQLVVVRKMGAAEPPLLPPSQAYFVRENLRLRLLNARASLLARDEAGYREDLRASLAWVQRYFDGRSKHTADAVAQLKQLSAVSITFEMPTISESLDAVRGYKSRRERVPGTG